MGVPFVLPGTERNLLGVTYEMDDNNLGRHRRSLDGVRCPLASGRFDFSSTK